MERPRTKSSSIRRADSLRSADVTVHARRSLGETVGPFVPRFGAAIVYFLVVLTIALQRNGGADGQVYNPGPDTRLDAGDVMIVLGRDEQLQSLREYVQGG